MHQAADALFTLLTDRIDNTKLEHKLMAILVARIKNRKRRRPVLPKWTEKTQ